MGAAKRFSARVSAGADPTDAVRAALAAAEEFSAEARLGESTAARLAVIVEELVSNALRHGAGERATTVEVELECNGEAIRVALDDDGVAFDPTTSRHFDGPNAETGGGVGLALVKAWVSEFRYARVAGRNRMTMLLANAP